MPVTIATHADIPALNTLVNTAYRGEESKKGWATEADLLSGSRIDEQTLTGYINDAAVTILKYIDKDSEAIKGCVYLENKTGHLYLGMLSVLPQLQASGIGRTILEAAESFARDNHLSIIRMTVITSRTELIAWYKRRGYEATGEILPFKIPEKFGIPKKPMELLLLEKKLTFQ